MKKNKLILFDWGNIVEDKESMEKGWNELFRMLGYKRTDDVIPCIRKYELTGIDSMDKLKEVYNKMKIELDLSKDFNEFLDNYDKVFDKTIYYKDVRDYEHSLKDKCYIGILSNLLIIDKRRINNQLDLSKYDYVFLSFELSSRKPYDEIYEKIMKQIPFNSSDILFIDDSKKNIETADKFGWNTLNCTGKELDLIKEKCDEFLMED